MTDNKAEAASTDTPGGNRPAVDVLALTDQESWDFADLAAAAGVDADALQCHLDGVGPLSQIAFHHVFAKLVGTQATTA